MPFDVHQLDNLTHESVEDVLDEYIEAAISQFEASSEGQAFAAEYPDSGGWVRSFIELGYNYEGRSLPAMSQSIVKQMMESLLPRKITVMAAAEAEAAIPELVAFWSFLSRDYQLPNADQIAKYLQSIQGKFGEWMVDPARGGMAKNFILSGMQAGYDMTSEEGLMAYQQASNAQMLGNLVKSSLKQKLANLFGGDSASAAHLLALPPQQGKQKTEMKQKGFGAAVETKASRKKKKK